jgi:hypothetical protein
MILGAIAIGFADTLGVMPGAGVAVAVLFCQMV